MRDLLDKIKLIEDADDLDQLKTVISKKIKNLPDDDATVKALQEIEDLLKHVNAGGKMGIINGELQKIDDPIVQQAQKQLARYIMSIDMTPAQRDELFDLWRNDKLVDRKALLEPGVKKNITDIFNKYKDNPVIKELIDDLMRIAALGQGKGEFGLGVLSKSINFPPKGDLLIDDRKIEVKTTDGGAGRFTDQEVTMGKGFEAAARELNDYLVNNLGVKVAKSGANLKVVIDAYRSTKDENLLGLIDKVIGIIFEGEDVSKIVDAIKAGNFGAAMQEYAKTSFEYYISKKDDEGVLYIALDKDPVMTVYFEDADDLDKSQMRLHAGTVYLTSINDKRLQYPQMKIVGTSQGGAVASGAAGVTVADPVDVAAQAEKVKDTKSKMKAEPKREPISKDAAVLGRAKK